MTAIADLVAVPRLMCVSGYRVIVEHDGLPIRGPARIVQGRLRWCLEQDSPIAAGDVLDFDDGRLETAGAEFEPDERDLRIVWRPGGLGNVAAADRAVVSARHHQRGVRAVRVDDPDLVASTGVRRGRSSLAVRRPVGMIGSPQVAQ